MINVYESERDSILKTIQAVQMRWWGKPNSAENMDRITREIQGRLEDLGFESIVDPTPTLEGLPVDVRITGRVDKGDELKFDHEKKRYEIIHDSDSAKKPIL